MFMKGLYKHGNDIFIGHINPLDTHILKDVLTLTHDIDLPSFDIVSGTYNP